MGRAQRRYAERSQKRKADAELIEVKEIRVIMSDDTSYALDLRKVDIIQKDTRKPIFQMGAQ